MSGIEVAGLLLAVIPLFISAAEHYREGLDIGKRCWNKDRVLRQYRVELEFQRVYLVLNLKALLVDVDLDFSVKEALVGASDADPATSKAIPALNDAWEQPHVKKRLVQRLGEAHDSFVSLLQRVSQVLISQVKKHDALHDRASIKESSPADCSLMLQAFHDKLRSAAGVIDARALWQCIKFSWQETERNQMIINLQDNNDKLQTLLRMLQAVKPFYAEQRSSRAQNNLDLRQQVRHMHQVLSQHCRCSHLTHEARLGLKRSQYMQKCLDDACFETILYRDLSTPWHITVHITPAPIDVTARSVKINIGNNEDCWAKRVEKRQAMADICLALSASETQASRFDLIIDEQCRLWQVSLPQGAPMPVRDCFYTLEALLNAASLHRKEPKWLAREKRILCVILCHSLLHLEGSEWLRRGWRAQAITLLQDQEISLSRAPRFRLNEPYISAVIATAEVSLMTKAQDLTINEGHGHPIPSLLNLGIILLELYLNGPLESAEDVEPMANTQMWAMSVLGSCREDKDMEPSYYNAIHFCLWPPWPPAGVCSFENTSFRDDYHQKVVAPLEDALTEGFDFSKEELAAL